MLKAINIWSFGGNLSFKQQIELAREAGFSGFEVDLSPDGPVNLSSTKADLEAVAGTARDAGITLSALATGLYWGANACSAEEATRAKARSILRTQIETAHHLGIDAVLVVAGAVGVDFLPGSEVVGYADALSRARDFIADALPTADQFGVTLCIENVWNKFLLSPVEMRDFIDQFASPRVGAYFDVGNALAIGYPEDWILTLGSRIKRVHFKDYRRAVGTVDGFCDLLSGDVDWPKVVAALRAVKYDGWVAAEMIPPVPFYKHCPEVLIHNTSRALDAIFRL